MTPPADLAALRKLVEAVVILRKNLLATCHDGVSAWSWYDEDTKQIDAALPAAREALERVEQSVATLCHVVCGDDDELASLKARIATMESALVGTAEWQRVHGAGEQAARDVAYWRRRAEAAEARLAMEGRDE